MTNAIGGYKVVSQVFRRPVVKASSDGGFFADSACGPQTFVKDRLDAGESLFLPVSHMMTAITLRHKKIVMIREENTLSPLLEDTIEHMYDLAQKDGTKEFLGAVLNLIGSDKGVTKAAVARAGRIREDASAKPVGHYEKTEILQKYFQAMTLLSMGAADISLDSSYAQSISNYLFDFEVMEELVAILRKNSQLFNNWEKIYNFYYALTGEPDLPTIVDLVKNGKAVTRELVLSMAQKNNLPKINRYGIAFEGMGRRFTLWAKVIDDMKSTLTLEESFDEEAVLRRIRMHPTIYGYAKTPVNFFTERVPGLLERFKNEGALRQAYSDVMVGASLEILMSDRIARDCMVAGLPLSSLRSYNAAAVGLLHAASINSLMAKKPFLGPISSFFNERAQHVYIEKASIEFWIKMIKAENIITKLEDGFSDYSLSFVLPYDGIEESLSYIADVSLGKKNFIDYNSEKKAHLQAFCELDEDPNVIATSFEWNNLGKKNWYTWATVMADAEVTLENGNGVQMKITAPEMAFAEGWSRQLVPSSIGPLTDSVWSEHLLTLNELPREAMVFGSYEIPSVLRI